VRPDKIIIVSLFILYFIYKIYTWLNKNNSVTYLSHPYVKKPSLKLSNIVKNNRCHQLSIPSYSDPRNNCEILMQCINEKIGMSNEDYYWREERVEISASFFSMIKNQFPTIAKNAPVADSELKAILPFIIENGHLEKKEATHNQGFDYRYTLITGDKISSHEAKQEYEKIMVLINDHSEIYIELIGLDSKWQVKKYMSGLISNDWLPKKYWH
jgi:ribulose bisphosphate carboxylase small subunit